MPVEHRHGRALADGDRIADMNLAAIMQRLQLDRLRAFSRRSSTLMTKPSVTKAELISPVASWMP
jgi:hypothetical protein